MKTAVDRVRRGQGAGGQRALRGDGEPLPVRGRVLQPGRRVGEGTGREERAGCPAPAVADAPAFAEPRCAERLAAGTLRRAVGGDGPSAAARAHGRRCAGRGAAAADAAARPFDGFVEHTKRVSPTCLIHFERNRYSVPASFANRPVSLRVYADRLVIAAEGQILCEHGRIIDRSHTAGRTVYDWRHYLACSSASLEPCATARRSPSARGIPAAAGASAAPTGRRPGDGGDPGPGTAARRAGGTVGRRTGVGIRRATKHHILNLLGRLLDSAPPAPIDAPQALTLSVEPQANVERYDELRGARHAA